MTRAGLRTWLGARCPQAAEAERRGGRLSLAAEPGCYGELRGRGSAAPRAQPRLILLAVPAAVPGNPDAPGGSESERAPADRG